MAIKPKNVYRGRIRRSTRILTIAGAALLLLIAIAIVAFDGFQKYIVYEPDGLRVVFPILASEEDRETETQESAVVPENVQVDLVIDAPDFDSIESSAGSNLSELHAVLLTEEALLAGKLTETISRAAALGADTVLIELKSADGQLAYASDAAYAASFATSGSAVLPELIAAVQDAGLHPAALLSCCADTLLATRNSPIALRAADGEIWEDAEGQRWVDARCHEVRAYLSDLIAELAEAGMEEIVLSNLAIPAGDNFASESSAIETDAVTAVSNFAVAITKLRDSLGVKISVLCSDDADEADGQNAALFAKVFDRAYLPDAAGNFAALFGASASVRCVPLAYSAPASGSWLLQTS